MGPECGVRRGLVVALLLAAWWPAGALAGVEGLALDGGPFELLGGRLVIGAPAGTRLAPRQADIMGAAEAAEEESRLVLDHQGTRLVVMAYELYARSSGDFAAAVRRDLLARLGEQTRGWALEPLEVATHLAAVAFSPPAPTGAGHANLVLGAYVRHPDGMAMLLAFYVSPEGVPAVAAWTALARRMVAGLARGTRTLDLGGGELRLATPFALTLVLEAPAGVGRSAQHGPDFVVHRLRAVTPLGEVGASCGLYLGHSPSSQHRQVGEPAGRVVEVDGVLLGQAVTWRRWGGDGLHWLEGMVAVDDREGLTLHAFCSAPTLPGLRPLQAMLATLRVERAP